MHWISFQSLKEKSSVIRYEIELLILNEKMEK